VRPRTEGKGNASGELSDAYLNTKTRTHDGKRTAKRPLDYYKLPGGVSQEKK